MARWPIAALFAVLLSSGAWAQSIVLQPVVSGLNQPVYFTNAHDGTHRRFIVEQSGRILVMPADSTTTSVFLDIQSRVRSGGEQGLLGLAFHPQFSVNRRFFVDYTRQGDGATVIAEYRASSTNQNAAETSSEIVLLVIPQPFTNHNGGMIEFGPDNLLYIGMGDGGSGNDPQNHAQNTNDLLGKILRIDVDHAESATVPYTSASANPFFGALPGRDEIFAYGFRNPWRFSFDHLTGQLYVGDVGQDAREEVDVVTVGGNYGWRIFEGTRCTNLDPGSCSGVVVQPPITEYIHGTLGRCSVTGGYVYRGTQRTLPYGAYVFADYCSGEIFSYQNGTQSVLLDTALTISSFGEDETGELYVVALDGTVSRIAAPAPAEFTQRRFTVLPSAGLSLPSRSAGSDLILGYARILPDSGSALPNGLAVFGYRSGGVLVSETSVPATALMQSGRILAAIGGGTDTGIAIANPNSLPVTVSFYFTNTSGQDFGQGSFQIAALDQFSAFLSQSPFNGASGLDGTFTFSTNLPVTAIALQGTTNARSDFLMTTLPVAALTAIPGGATIFPHWADGDGWSTEFALINPSDQTITGSFQMRDAAGTVVSTSSYSIPRRSSKRFAPLSFTPIRTGYATITPSSGPTPSGIALFRLTTGAGLITQTGVASIPASLGFRGYGEMSATVRTGVAVANLSTSTTVVTVELTRWDNGGTLRGTITLPPSGQRGMFLDEIDGLTNLNTPFQGMVRVTAPGPIAVTGLRGHLNERGEFLVSADAPIDESTVSTNSNLFFSHFAVGAGYETQFVLFPSQIGGTQTGSLLYFCQNGEELEIFTP
jgi:hypothetical protein